MSKELFVSSTPHETKVAISEDDQLTEVYFERENEYTLAGSIYKGRVTRVLPGMQSAFVEIGLERDAFLYVTDFFEAPEGEDDGEFETSPALPDGRRDQHHANGGSHDGEQAVAEAAPEPGNEAEESTEPASPAGEPAQRSAEQSDRGREGRGRFGRRRRGRRGRGFPESKYDRGGSREQEPGESPREAPPVAQAERRPAPAYQPIVLPGESISKYRNLPPVQAAPASEQPEPVVETQHAVEQSPLLSHAELPHVTEEPRGEAHIHLHAEAPPKRPTEEIDVVSILEQHRASGSAQAEQQEPKFTSAFGASSGVVEEEEIDEEESEHHSGLQTLDDEEYEDFEEETLDRVDAAEHRVSSASNLPEDSVSPSVPEAANRPESHSDESEAQREGDAELDAAELSAAEIEGGFEEEGDDEYDEQESQPGNGSEAEPAVARAEMRGPSGHQQRVGFDRNRNRQRRGARRNVRGPHGRKFHRGPLPKISDLLKEGQEILVQIAKEPIGKKGARITSHIALPGRFLVYMPTVNHNGVSRKIASEEERLRLKRIIISERQNANGNQEGGFIVRTAAGAASEEDLRADIRFLLNLWNEIKNRAESNKAPTLIYHDLNLVERVLRDQLSEGFSHIWVDSEQEYERMLRFVNRFQPGLVKRVKLYTKETPLFEEFNIQDEINKALKSKVWLKSGGYIVINQTEALVAIDVNTGKYVGKTQKLEDTIVKTNVDAIREIVRQIRLRDLGGIIVIDFIDMDERRNRQKVMQALEEALKSDRAPSKVLQFNDFGLVAITRKRVKQSLERTLGSSCTYCTGTGLIKSVATVCNEVYVELRKMMHHLEGGDIILRVNPEVGKALKANNARWLQDMEDLTGKTVIVKADPTLHQEQFDIH
ncbi:MAG TPA: Rne/Rng family ribonuclease [Terriglobales bacterium]|nr:Rne/Rng family ribonuclease [Terriglobales bacterium]